MKKAITLIFFVVNVCLSAQEVRISLWDKDVPNQKKSRDKEKIDSTNIVRISNVQYPMIDVYLPSKSNANGQAMLIFPGGGYGILAYDWEGSDIAKVLNAKGIAGIVVKYRLPNSKSIKTKHLAPLQDAQRAMRLVRANAAKWNIKNDQIGVIGFSAGGHLASTIGTHYNDEVYQKRDSTDDLSARPDFMALIYPVITFTNQEVVHKGSRNNLLGDLKDDTKLNAYFSNELHVTKETPPVFLLHAQDDLGVPVENSLLFYKALQKVNVLAEMHLYPKGGHGFSLAAKNKHLSTWATRLTDWILTQKDKEED